MCDHLSYAERSFNSWCSAPLSVRRPPWPAGEFSLGVAEAPLQAHIPRALMCRIICFCFLIFFFRRSGIFQALLRPQLVTMEVDVRFTCGYVPRHTMWSNANQMEPKEICHPRGCADPSSHISIQRLLSAKFRPRLQCFTITFFF